MGKRISPGLEDILINIFCWFLSECHFPHVLICLFTVDLLCTSSKLLSYMYCFCSWKNLSAIIVWEFCLLKHLLSVFNLLHFDWSFCMWRCILYCCACNFGDKKTMSLLVLNPVYLMPPKGKKEHISFICSLLYQIITECSYVLWISVTYKIL